jgi:hypothetical protein
VQCHTAQRDAAGVLARRASQRVDQRCLAGAVAPEQRQRLTFGQRQLHAIEHHGLTVTGAQAFHL